MKKEIEKLTAKVTTLTKANAALKKAHDALALQVESLEPISGEGGASSADMRRARQCFEAGDTNGAIAHILGGYS